MPEWPQSTRRRAARIFAAATVCFAIAGCATFERVGGGLRDVGGDLRKIVVGPSAPTPAEEIAKADHSEREGGIGGTGVETTEALRGEGAAGAGRTAVFGTVTGFGSIFVGGQRVHVEDRLVVSSRIGQKRGEEIELGEIVALTGARDDEALRAEAVESFLPIIGPVEAGAPDGSVLIVLGTEVLAPADAPVVDHASGRPLERAALVPGVQVAVSGLWWGERIVATRIAVLTTPTLASISGQIRLENGEAKIGGTRLVAANLRDGGFATAFGRRQDGAFVAARLDYAPLGVFAAPFETLIVEGYLAPNPNDDGHHLSGFGLPLDQTSPIPRTTDARAVFSGGFDAEFQADTLTLLPETAAERRAFLTP